MILPSGVFLNKHDVLVLVLVLVRCGETWQSRDISEGSRHVEVKSQQNITGEERKRSNGVHVLFIKTRV